jgi:hypothetical protein
MVGLSKFLPQAWEPRGLLASLLYHVTSLPGKDYRKVTEGIFFKKIKNSIDLIRNQYYYLEKENS